MFYRLFIIAVVLCQFGAQAQTLATLQQKTSSRLQAAWDVRPELALSSTDTINKWLQGPVSMQFSALKSQSDLGTNEYEVGLLLPFRSPQGHDLDEQQRTLISQVEQARKARFTLMVSGLIREAAWQVMIAQSNVDALDKKGQWLTEFGQVMAQQFAAGEISEVTQLQWQQENISHSLAMQKAQFSLAQAWQHFRQVTGSNDLPDTVEETVVADPSAMLAQHPELRLLRLSQSQVDLTLAESDQQLMPWTVGVIARQLNGPAGNENLLGVTLDIPLPTGSHTSASNYALWKTTRDAIIDSSAETYSRLQQQLSVAMADQAYYQKAQALLQSKVELGEQINAIYQRQQGEVPQALWLQQLIDHQNLLLELTQNRILLAQSASQINQISGVSL